MMMLIGRGVSGLALLVLSVALAVAQIGTSTLTGRVTDSSGAVVPGVAVTVVNTDTNFQYAATTNQDGLFRVQSLPPGPYRLTFEAAGFKRLVRDGITLTASDTRPVDATLDVGTVTESVEVKAQAQLLETETTSSGALVVGNMYYKLPIYQRSVHFTLTITPGLSLGSYGSAANGSTTPFNVAGARSTQLGVFEDGVLGMNPNGSSQSVRSVENSVAEVKVLTSTLPAEYGHTAGGVISIVKKSGTNEFHGMASEFGRVRRMQHRLFFDRFRTSDPQPGAPHGVGTFFMYPDASAGGPVYIPKVYDGRNKTFFFFGWQKQIEKKSAIVTQQTPTLDMLGGDFSFNGVGNQIYDPLSTARNTDGTWTRSLFPNRIVPLNRMDPVSRKIVQINPWNPPNLPGSFNSGGPVSNYVYSENARAFMEEYSMRLDHQFNSAFKIYSSYTYDYALNRGRPTNIHIRDFDGPNGSDPPFSNHNISTGGTWVMGPTVVNDARASLFRQENTKPVPSFGKGWAATLGIPNVSPELMPAFGTTSTGNDQFAPVSAYGLTVSGPTHLIDEALSFRDDLTKVHGLHAFKVGYELLHNRSNSAATLHPSGEFLFDTMTAGLQPNGQPLPNTGNTFAGFLVGAVRQATFDSELTTWLPRSCIHSFYFQDDWKFKPSLTFNLGIRYSTESPFNTKYGLMSNFDPSGTDPLTGFKGAIAHPTSPLSKRDTNNFQPRIGVAWHPMQKWVFRGGFTVNTIDVRFPLSRDQFDEYGAQAVQAQLPGDPRPIYNLSQGPQPIKFNIVNGTTSPFVGTNYSTRNVAWWDPNLRNPYVMNWQAGLQYEVKSNYVLDVYYQGSAGVALLERWQANTFPLDLGASDPSLRNAAFAAPQNYRPYRQFGDILFRSNTGHSTYHAATIKLERRYHNGLMFSTFYTFAKSIDSQDGDNTGAGVAPLQNRSLEKARAGFDRNHRYNATAIYALPIGKGKRFLNRGGIANLIFGGIELSWIQMVESGLPLSFSFANSPFNYFPTFAGARRADVTGRPALRDGWGDFGGDRFNQANIYSVIDMNYFSYPAAFTPGNSGRNIVTGTRLLYSQGSAQKNIPFKERWNFQIRLDFQNVFHNYAWSNPTTTVDYRNPQTFGKISADQRTSSIGGQPLMNLKLQLSW